MKRARSAMTVARTAMMMMAVWETPEFEESLPELLEPADPVFPDPDAVVV
jgi:hypothetical protein